MLTFQVVEKDEQLDNATLTLGFPDAKGVIVKLPGVSEADMDSFEEGAFYQVAPTRYTPQTNVPPAQKENPSDQAGAGDTTTG